MLKKFLLLVLFAVSFIGLVPSGCDTPCVTDRYQMTELSPIRTVDYEPSQGLFIVRDTLVNRLIFEADAKYRRTVEAETSPIFTPSVDFLPKAFANDCPKEAVVPGLREFAIYFDRPVILRTADNTLRQVPALTNLDPFLTSTLAPVPDLYVGTRPNPFGSRLAQFRIEINPEAVRLDSGNYEVGVRYILDDGRMLESKKKFFRRIR